MATSPRTFLIEMYEEHLEEADFLYQHGVEARKQHDYSWLDLSDNEDRLEAHIDALVVGNKLAIQVCKRRALEGEPGELHAAIRVFCRQQSRSDVFDVLIDLDFDDADRVAAVTDALKWDLPMDWSRDITRLVDHGHPHLIPLMATVAGYRRLPIADTLLRARKRAQAEHLSTLVWALGRLGMQAITETLYQSIEGPTSAARAQTATALLRLGNASVIARCKQLLRDGEVWAAMPATLGGNRDVGALLLEYVRAGAATPAIIHALALVGDLAAVDTLIPLLDNELLAPSAALALTVLTGAMLEETVFIEAEIDEDELSAEELERFRAGEKILKLDGTPYGNNVTRIAQGSETWSLWWQKNCDQFDATLRYRLGKPYSPAMLLQTLVSPRMPNALRAFAHDELSVRFGIETPFEADAPIVQQRQQLYTLAQWVKANENTFQPGAWAFKGRVIHV